MKIVFTNGEYFLILLSFTSIVDLSLTKSNYTVFKRNNGLQRYFLGNLTDNLKFKDKIKESGLYQYEEEGFLGEFNLNRAKADPPAADMNELGWSDGLAKLAKHWGDMCPSVKGFDTEDCEKLFDQNVYITNAPTVSLIFFQWNIERQHYDFDSNLCKTNCKNYKTMMRAEYHSVGCSKSQCEPIKATYVCIFYPPAKDVDSQPYKKGPSCSNCPNNEKCLHGGLCEKTDRHVPLAELCECSGVELPTNPPTTMKVEVSFPGQIMNNKTIHSNGSGCFSNINLILFLIELTVMY